MHANEHCRAAVGHSPSCPQTSRWRARRRHPPPSARPVLCPPAAAGHRPALPPGWGAAPVSSSAPWLRPPWQPRPGLAPVGSTHSHPLCRTVLRSRAERAASQQRRWPAGAHAGGRCLQRGTATWSVHKRTANTGGKRHCLDSSACSAASLVTLTEEPVLAYLAVRGGGLLAAGHASCYPAHLQATVGLFSWLCHEISC